MATAVIVDGERFELCGLAAALARSSAKNRERINRAPMVRVEFHCGDGSVVPKTFPKIGPEILPSEHISS
jgi:hypothetical protein